MVFLHGGPGIADLAGDAASSFGRLTDDGSAGGVKARLPWTRRLRLYALLARPRALLGYTLLQVNPRAAHAFVGDAEMDARNDRVYNAGRAGTPGRDQGPGPALHGLGFYTYQDQPAQFLAVVRAFLNDRPLPVPPWPGGGVPADYEGPPDQVHP